MENWNSMFNDVIEEKVYHHSLFARIIWRINLHRNENMCKLSNSV